jgi:predicted nucleic acid-binding protein
MTPVAVDTGPIVALLNARDRHHDWAREFFAANDAPLLTCEAVLAEACWLLRRSPGGPAAVLSLVSSGALRVSFDLEPEARPLAALMKRYESVPMSLADASLVRMAELERRTRIATLDSDFLVYRRERRVPLDLVMPERH